jgi:hypothetical protein
MPPRETLAVASSRPNPEALATRVVLAHPRTAFHPYMCGLRVGAAVVAAALISYDDLGGYYWETCEPKMIVIDYFLYTDA